MTQTLESSTKEAPMLRPANLQDIEAIASLGATTFTNSFGFSMPASDLQEYLGEAYSVSSLAKDFANPLVDIVVACDSLNRVIGFVQLTQGTIEACIANIERPIELQRLYVDESHHGGGIGRALENEVERISRERGFKTIWLGVWEDNFKAQKVYERFGFSKVGSHEFVMGTCVQTDWILTKTL